MLASQNPGPLLRSLRLERRLTQEALAERAEVSTRHLSYLETGRARPSQTMLLVLANALDLPLRSRNTLLLAGGFAPVYAESPLAGEAMQRVQQAVSHILAMHEPHPALLLDKRWNVLQMNAGAARFFAWCEVRVPQDQPVNALRLFFDAQFGLRDKVCNFDVLAYEMQARLRHEAELDASSLSLLHEVEQWRGNVKKQNEVSSEWMPVALPIHFRKDNIDLNYFTTITTLGTPLDVTAQELRIEGYFPLDKATEAFARQLATEAR